VTPRRIALAVWDFVVGDDWRLALAAVVAIGLTAVACALGPSAWWLAPLIALGALRWSLRGTVPAARPSPDGGNDPTPKAGGPAVDQSGVQSSPK
jgi:hypothetical protein